MSRNSVLLCLLVAGAAIAGRGWVAHAQQPPADPLRFRSGVDLVNLTATVADGNGRFVTGLRQEDFVIYEDDVPQEILHFSAERVPVSLGLAVDTSNSMAGEKIEAARLALRRFFDVLLDPADEIFLFRFSDIPVLLQGWTTDRVLLSQALRRLTPEGGTALYDTVAESLPMAESGQHGKKAILLISDGNDTSSRIGLSALKAQLQRSEALVYAIGIDRDALPSVSPVPPRRPGVPIPIPNPFPPRRPPGTSPRPFPGQRPRRMLLTPADAPAAPQLATDRVNERTLRELTDASGGRTEIVRDARDLTPATSAIADELSRQYALAYPASSIKDGRWRAIRVEVRGRPNVVVRTRAGYVAN